jgi:hypothetical protein
MKNIILELFIKKLPAWELNFCLKFLKKIAWLLNR